MVYRDHLKLCNKAFSQSRSCTKLYNRYLQYSILKKMIITINVSCCLVSIHLVKSCLINGKTSLGKFQYFTFVIGVHRWIRRDYPLKSNS